MHYNRENDTVSEHLLLSNGMKHSSRIRTLLIASVVMITAVLVVGAIAFTGV